MARSANTTAGERLRSFIRDLVLAEQGIGKTLADRVAERVLHNVDRLVELHAELKAAGKTPPARGQAAEEFDPYAFGAVVTLERSGRAALLERLDAIKSVEHLRELAEAQHLSVDPGLSDPAELRLAIVAGAEGRVADRRAAAS